MKNKETRINEIEAVDRAKVAEIKYAYGGYLSGHSSIVIKKNKNGAIVQTRRARYGEGKAHEEKVSISTEKWEQIVSKLYDEICIQEWERNYDNWGILDGMQWKFVITAEDGKMQRHEGSNAFPQKWDEFKSVFSEYDKSIAPSTEHIDWDGFKREFAEYAKRRREQD